MLKLLKAQFKDDIGCAQYSAIILAQMHQHRMPHSYHLPHITSATSFTYLILRSSRNGIFHSERGMLAHAKADGPKC